MNNSTINQDACISRYHLSRSISQENMPKQKREVYLVDDDKDDLYLSSKALSKSERIENVHQVSDASILFDVMKEDGYFDESFLPLNLKPIIMLDIHMPNINGIETLALIKGHPFTSDLSVILLSSDSSADKIHKAYDLQANGYLEKPCELHHFHNILDGIELGQGGFKVNDYNLN